MSQPSKERSPFFKVVAGLALLQLILCSCCFLPGILNVSRIAWHRIKWEQRGGGDYKIALSGVGITSFGEELQNTSLTVCDGEVVAIDKPFDPNISLENYQKYTVNGLFANALSECLLFCSLKFDPDYGYPTLANSKPAFLEDGWLKVDDFELISCPLSP